MSSLLVDEHDSSFEQRLARVVFRDGVERVRLCTADLVIADLARRLATTPALGGSGSSTLTRLEIPRGAHDIAVVFAFEAQLARLRELRESQGQKRRSTAVNGSIVVIGTDTAVHARLGQVSVEGTPLEHLRVHRIRSDGRLVASGSGPLSFQPGRGELLYLNTRIGWPQLSGERDGLTIIDRTSFGSPDLLDAAIQWAQKHGARHIVVLHDHGNLEAQRSATARWIVDGVTLAALDPPISVLQRGAQPASGLTLSRLLSGKQPTLGIARVEAPDFEALSATIHGHILAARQIGKQLPYPLFAAARMLSLSNVLAGQVRTYDRAAAMIPRLQPLRDLARAVEKGDNRLQGPWAGYRETRFAALRADVIRLFSALEQSNPKFEALVFLLDDLQRRRPRPSMVIRVTDDAAAFALEEDLLEFDPALTDGVRFVSFRHRLNWDPSGLVEVLAGLPAPWRREAIWSGEARERIVLAYGWEANVLGSIAANEAKRVRAHVPPRLASVSMEPAAAVSVPVVFHHEQRVVEGEVVPRKFDIDLTAIIADVEPEIEPYGTGAAGEQRGLGTWPVLVRAVTLDPDGAVWLVPEGLDVEVLVGPKFRRLPASDLVHGAEVLVPRGSGRESLFARALAMIEGHGTYTDVEFVLGRWRRACRALLEKAGTPERARRMLHEEGATTFTQLEAWADGSTLAPNDYEDMARVARLAGDEWLNRNWKRVAMLVRQIRGSHIRLGQTISGAMREAIHGRGPNLESLAELLGVDAASILDEFAVRIVRSVSAPLRVPAAIAGSVLPPK